MIGLSWRPKNGYSAPAAIGTPITLAEGRQATLACSLAKFTLASSTPGVFWSAFTPRLTHDMQVMPVIGMAILSLITP